MRKDNREKSVSAFIQDLTHDLPAINATPSGMLQDLYRVEPQLLLGAIHEAGHCVATWSLGFPIIQMNISEIRPGLDGVMQKSSTYKIAPERHNENPLKTYADRAIIALASLVAERKAFPDISNEFAWGGDLEMAAEYMAHFSSDDEDTENELEVVLEDTEIIIDDHWRKVEILAIGAYKLGLVLSGEQVKELIESAE